MNKLRIVFMGTPDLSCASLQALLETPGFEVTAVVTQPDRPKGRDLKLQPSPVKELAQRTGLPVLQPERARSEDFLAQLREYRPDLIVVAAYGQLLPQSVLNLPTFGCLNVHTSLLPKYRGAAPIQWAILNDEAETGVTIMKMDPGLDTGDILATQKTPINAEDNGETLHDRLARLGADLLVRAIPPYIAGTLKPEPQPAEGVSFAPKIKKQDGQIDWRLPSRAIWNRVRGLAPWPGAFTFLPGQPHPHLLKIWQSELADRSGPAGEVLVSNKTGIIVACGHQSLCIQILQREGGRRLSAEHFLAGHPLRAGEHLG